MTRLISQFFYTYYWHTKVKTICFTIFSNNHLYRSRSLHSYSLLHFSSYFFCIGWKSYTTEHTAQQHPTETVKSFNIVFNRMSENLEKMYMENVQLAYFQWIYSIRCVSFVESAHCMKEKFLWNHFIKNICLIISINGSMLNKISDQIEIFTDLRHTFNEII